MKSFEDFLKAVETDDVLKTKVKEAFEGAEVKSGEEKISVLVKVAAENGYNVTTEDFAKKQADGKELDEDELTLVSGGKESCLFDYACALVWNSCLVNDESFCTTLTESCKNNVGDQGWG